VGLHVEYIDGTKIESKANKYTFVWSKITETNRAKLVEKIRVLFGLIDECIAQEGAYDAKTQSFTPAELRNLSEELNCALEQDLFPRLKRVAKP
jgi:hypothetical protein